MKGFFMPQVLKSAIIILTVLSFVAGGSYSAWTSQVKVTNNNFETGTIEISVTPAASLFNLNNMSPGVWSGKDLTVQNSGTLNYNYSFGAEATGSSQDSLKLFNSLWAEIYVNSDTLIAADWLASLKTDARLLESGDSEKITIKIKLDDDADNSYQNLAAAFNFVFDATQALGNEVSGNVVINEIAWMGTVVGSSDEWIELYNSSDKEVGLDGWKIREVVSGNEYNLSGVISSKEYYLIEDKEQTTDVPADVVSGLSLSNDGEQLVLLDDDGEEVDRANGTGAWLAGKNDVNKPTMERKSWLGDGTLPESWADNNGITKNGLDVGGNSIYGTPKAKNSATE